MNNAERYMQALVKAGRRRAEDLDRREYLVLQQMLLMDGLYMDFDAREHFMVDLIGAENGIQGADACYIGSVVLRELKTRCDAQIREMLDEALEAHQFEREVAAAEAGAYALGA